MGIHFAGNEYSKAYVGPNEVSKALIGADEYHTSAISYSIDRTLDRTFTDTPASGGGNVPPDTFTHEGNTWQLWQAIPFLGNAVSSTNRGRCRVHLRNRGVSRNAMTLESMPTRIVISGNDWDGLPWEFTRPTSTATFSSPGGGNSARRSLDYIPVRTIAAGDTPASVGIAQGESFTITLHFERV